MQGFAQRGSADIIQGRHPQEAWEATGVTVTRVDEDNPWSVNAHLQTQGLMGDRRLSVKGQVSGSRAAPKTTSIERCVLRGTGEQETEGEMAQMNGKDKRVPEESPSRLRPE